MKLIKSISVACIMVSVFALSAHADAIYAGDYNISGLSDFHADYVGSQRSTTSSCGPIAPSSTHVWWFTIDGMPYSSYTEWYVTYKGGSPVDTDDLWGWNDPQVGIKFTTAGTYTIRAEIWTSEWVQAHRFTVTVEYPSYTVYFDKQGGSGGSNSVTATYGSAMPSASKPSRYGYFFNGYFSGKNGGGTRYYYSNMSSACTWDIKQNTTLYAYWTANTYTVTFNKQGGSGGSSSVSATYDSSMPSASMPSRSGYSFQGYYTGKSGSGTKYYNSNMSSARNWDIASGTTLYAYWISVPEPDLRVKSIWTEPANPVAGETYVIKARVRNYGDADANPDGAITPIYVKFWEDGVEKDETGKDGLLWVYEIEVDEEKVYTSKSLTAPNKPSMTVKAMVDSRDTVDESNEGNNTLQATVSIQPPPRPDLIISSLSRSPDSGYAGQTITIKSVTKNVGNAGTGWHMPWKVRYYLGRSSGALWREIGWGWTPNLNEYNGLSIGEEDPDSITWTVDSDLSPGRYYITAVADADNEIDEGAANEGNNAKTVTFDVLAVPKPDLKVRAIWTEPANPVAGESYVIKARVRNYGDADANPDGAITPIYVKFWEDGVEKDETGKDGLLWVYEIEVDEEKVYTSKSLTAPNKTSMTVKAMVDSRETVDESDDGNNTLQTTVSLQPPLQSDLIGTGSFPDQEYYPGDTIKFTLAIKNDGEGAANAGLVHYYACKGPLSYAEKDRLTDKSTSYDALPAKSDWVYKEFKWKIPSDAEPGIYAVSFWIDATNTTPNETDEENNKGGWIVNVGKKTSIYISSSTPPNLTDKNYLPHLVDADGPGDKFDPFIDWDADGVKDSGWTANTSRCFGLNDTVAIHVMVVSTVAATRTARVKAFYNRSSPSEFGKTLIGQTLALIPPIETMYNGLPVSFPGQRNLIVEWKPPAIGQYYIQVELEEYVDNMWVSVSSYWIDCEYDNIPPFPMIVTDKDPIILVHGWTSQGEKFGELELILELTQKRPVRKFEYETVMFDGDNWGFGSELLYPRVDVGVVGKTTLIEQLHDFVSKPNGANSSGFQSFDAIAHSYGGLIVRRYAIEPYNKLKNLITLGTPNYGGDLANVFDNILNNQAEDLEYGSSLQWRIYKGWISSQSFPNTLAIVGTDDTMWGNYNPTDGIVRCCSASLENLDIPVYYVPLPHSSGLAVGGIGPGMADINDREHPSWIPIEHFLNGHSYPYKNGENFEPGNGGGEDDMGHSSFIHHWPYALLTGGIHIIALNSSERLDIDLSTSPQQVVMRKAVVSSTNNINLKVNHEDCAATVYNMYLDANDNTDTKEFEEYTDYEVLLNLPGYPKLIQPARIKEGETTVVVFDVSGSPSTPIPLAPESDAILVSLTPTLRWSAFQSPISGRTQAGFQVRVRCDTDNDAIIYDTGFIANTSGHSHTYTPGAYTGVDVVSGEQRISLPLQYGKQYHWHIRYRDNTGVWSAWSADVPNPMHYFYTVKTGTFTIYSSHGNPNPSAGEYPWTYGQVMPSGNVLSPADQSEGTRWRCTGYTGTGSAPSGTERTYPSFKITEDSTLRWNWKAQYEVTPEAIGAGSILPSVSSWWDRGSEVTFSAIAETGYIVDKWLVNGTTVQDGGTEYRLNNVRKPSSVQVTFISTTPDNVAPVIEEGESIVVKMSLDGDPTPFSLTLHASDADGDSIYWDIGVFPSHGQASASGTGTSKMISYTPQTGYTGTDRFVVQINDGRGLTDFITVNVIVGSTSLVFWDGNLHFYELIEVPEGITWDQAKIAAESTTRNGIPGHLATITSAEENSFIVEAFQELFTGGVWIGADQEPGNAPDQGWRWATGEPWIYTNWRSAIPEPNDANGSHEEDALEFMILPREWYSHGYWNDMPRTSKLYYYLIEYPSMYCRRSAGGSINDQVVDAEHDTVSVIAGERLQGSFNVMTNNTMHSGAVAPLAATVTWGDRTTQYWTVNRKIRTGVNTYSIPVNCVAPNTPGDYYLIVGFSGMYTGAQVMSSTTPARDAVWHDGNDVGFDWTEAQFNSALGNSGVVWVNMLQTNNEFPICAQPFTAIKIHVEKALSAEYSLNEGWNLISINLDLTEKSQQHLRSKRAMTLSPTGNTYVFSDHLAPTQACWIYCRNAETFTLTGASPENLNFAANLKTGWNFVGPTTDSLLRGNGAIAWGWNGQNFYPTRNMGSGSGYYLYWPDKRGEITSLDSEYLIIDLSDGPSAFSYPIETRSAPPVGGWSDEYKTIKLVLRKITAGTFAMGSLEDELGHWNNETHHQLTLTKDFYIGVFEVTQRQWELVMGNQPSCFSNASYGDTRPVEQVSYADIRGSDLGSSWPASNAVDASSFLGRLRIKTGLTLDLPTEAQWEYACRAGTTTALNTGKNLTSRENCPNVAEAGRFLYNGGYSDGTAKVGNYRPNQWGLYDMHGNVWEWCLDWYQHELGSSAQADPRGAADGTYRVFRGGCWSNLAFYCRSAYRARYLPSNLDDGIGFRIVRIVP